MVNVAGRSNPVFQVLKAIRYRIRSSSKDERELQARRKALYNESFLMCQLRTQLEEVADEFDNFDRPVASIRVKIDPSALPFVTSVQDSLSCTITPCATPGEFILERESEYI